MANYYEFKVTLDGVKPPIWRTFWLKKEATFDALHHAIQVACGWQDAHLYSFLPWSKDDDEGDIATSPHGRENLKEWGEPVPPDARRKKIAAYFKDGKRHKKCRYLYDFGDGWRHTVELRRCIELPGKFTRKLLDGARAFPPEDCGGLGGYEDCVRATQGLRTDDREDLLAWLGEWQPEEFDIATVAVEFNT